MSFFSSLPLQILASILFLGTELKVNATWSTLCWFYFFFSHKKRCKSVSWVYVRQINNFVCCACVMSPLFQLFDFISLAEWFSPTTNPFFFCQIYMNKYIYSKLASRASYLYFLSLKYTVRCWQVPSTSSGFLAQLRLAFVNFKKQI